MAPGRSQVDPLDGLASDLETEREFVAARAPAYARLTELLMEEITAAVAERLRAAWTGRVSSAWYERPLLLLTSLRWAALTEGERHPLWSGLQIDHPDVDSITAEAVRASVGSDQRPFWNAVRDRHVQTNDVSRGIAWIWPAALAAAADPDRAIDLHDIGASAGLNLIADSIGGSWRRTDDRPLEVEPRPPIGVRSGYDLRPLDPLADQDANWLRALIWPGQGDRAARLEAAIDAYRKASRCDNPPRIHAANAVEVPGRLTAVRRGGNRAIAYQTVMRDYLSEDELDAYERGIEAWLERSEEGGAIWMELEVTDEARSGGAVLALRGTVRADGRTVSRRLALSEPHPVALDVDDAAVADFRAALR